ncbi:DUF4124 domain-containing protein [Arenimonas alkanexedens]
MRQSRVVTAGLLFSLWIGASLALGVSAAALYKCLDARGHASYQSQACPVASEQVWVRDAAPEPAGEPPVPPAPVASAKSPVDSRDIIRPSRGTASAGDSGRKSTSAGCQRARAADTAYRAQPLSRVTHDGLRRHGDRIRAACG